MMKDLRVRRHSSTPRSLENVLFGILLIGAEHPAAAWVPCSRRQAARRSKSSSRTFQGQAARGAQIGDEPAPARAPHRLAASAKAAVDLRFFVTALHGALVGPTKRCTKRFVPSRPEQIERAKPTLPLPGSGALARRPTSP